MKTVNSKTIEWDGLGRVTLVYKAGKYRAKVRPEHGRDRFGDWELTPQAALEAFGLSADGDAMALIESVEARRHSSTRGAKE